MEALKDALLTDEELAKGRESWKELDDPLLDGAKLWDLADLNDYGDGDEEDEDDENEDDDSDKIEESCEIEGNRRSQRKNGKN